MAKKKSKRESKDVGKIALLAILLFTVITIVMGFLANVKYSARVGDKSYTVSGFETMFGWKSQDEYVTIEWSSFSFMAFLSYLLPIAGLVLSFIFKKSKGLSLVPLVCFVASAIIFFVMPNFLILTDAGELATALFIESLGFGAIIAGILNILSAIAVATKILLS